MSLRLAIITWIIICSYLTSHTIIAKHTLKGELKKNKHA